MSIILLLRKDIRRTNYLSKFRIIAKDIKLDIYEIITHCRLAFGKEVR